MKTLGCILLIALFATTALAADATGKWSGTFAPEGQDPSGAFCVLKQSGTALTGTAGPDEGQQWPITNGKIAGNKITGDVNAPEGLVYKMNLVLEGDQIKGEVTVTRDGQAMKGKLELTRRKS